MGWGAANVGCPPVLGVGWSGVGCVAVCGWCVGRRCVLPAGVGRRVPGARVLYIVVYVYMYW